MLNGSKTSPPRLLTLNVGSSSLKAVLFHAGPPLRVEVRASAERIGILNPSLDITDPHATVLFTHSDSLPDHQAALKVLFDWLRARGLDAGLAAVGQRVVHGGRQYSAPTLITDTLLHDLRELVPLDTEHLPQALRVIEHVRHLYPDLPQVACFDTAFHRQMPRVAQMLPMPRELWDAGVVRYGFHGLSYTYILQELRTLDSAAADSRLIIAHLGNGASMAAIHHGVGVETTMGLSPTGGLVMSTRSGDLDPGVLVYLLASRGLDPTGLSRLVNKQAGLLGVSGISADMRDLLAREAEDPRAADAVALFCYQARKHVGALVAALGGLHTLVFTAGIGEHAAPVRARICDGLAYLGLELDSARNAAHAPIISTPTSRVVVRVIPTDEDLVIAQQTQRLVLDRNGSGG
ncbi:MAG: acetate/propionate family kinase [Chloroflexi bacterium]|nr:acetate/propionate family kinase [Chloroflexota bacterium]MBV9602275.1 acetate/propionate family kinase [Chloroflexota bacterium]